jgi:hypothetical protein
MQTSREKKTPRKQLAPSNAYAAKESSWPSALRISSWKIKPWIYLILAVVGLKTAWKFVGRWVLGLEGFYAGIVTTSLVFAILGWISYVQIESSIFQTKGVFEYAPYYQV